MSRSWAIFAILMLPSLKIINGEPTIAFIIAHDMLLKPYSKCVGIRGKVVG